MKKRCKICNSINLTKALDLGQNPLCDDLIKLNSKKNNRLYKIQISICRNCLTAFQDHEVDKKKLFPKNYHYRARFTKDVLDGFADIKNLSSKILKKLSNKNIVDIGCNDGSLLNLFKKNKANTIGIEPTDASKDAKKNGHDIYSEYFEKKTVKKIIKKYKKIDLIIFTNVFAHIENFDNLISNLKELISEDTYLIIENHYLGSVIDKNQFDTFYHEHPRTYSATSFIHIAKKLNMKIEEIQFPKRYGGNIRVIMNKKKGIKNFNFVKIKEKNFFKDLFKMQKNIQLWKIKKKKLIAQLNNKHGLLAAKAFPGRSAILIKLLDLDDKKIQAVYEKPGSMKIGNFVPSTRIPIKSDEELFKNITKLKVIINLAWHISSEIKSYLRKNKFKGKIVNILEQKDFL